jgi:dTDP-4-amino-4,6-dideoxygalactose transaminase
MSSGRPRIYLSPPHMGATELTRLTEAFNSNQIDTFGPHVDGFETEFAEKIGSQYAVAVSSGTAALHLSLRLLKIQSGDEVLTSTFSSIAPASAIAYLGARPVFIDSDAATWNMDPQLLEDELKRCTARKRLPKAALIVNVNGQCANYRDLMPICLRFGIPIVEDAAESLGAKHRDVNAGRFGAIGCFSLGSNKIITTSVGGILLTEDKAWADEARRLAALANEPGTHHEQTTIGYNYRMSHLLAAIGRGQLDVLEDRIAARRRLFDRYVEAFGDLPGISFMPEPDGFFSTRWMTSIIVSPEFGATPEDIQMALESENIESRPVWRPMHIQPLFSSCRSATNGVSERLFREGLCLPSGSSLTEDDQQRVVDLVRAQYRSVAKKVSS